MAKTLLDRKIGKIPKDWNSLKLGGFSKFSQGIQVGVEKHKTTFEEGYVRFIRIIDYTQNTDDIRYIKYPGDKYCVKEDDIVMVRYGTPGVIGRGIKGAIANNMFKIIPDNSLITNDYLSYSFIQEYIQKILSEGSGSSTMPAINFSMLNKIAIAIPPLPEQRKIAEILSTVDVDIEKTDAIIKETQQLKKGLTEKLFTEGIGHTRFKKTKIGRIPEGWDVVKLSDIVSPAKYSIVDGPFGSSINTSKDYIKSGVPVIRTVNIRPLKFITDDLRFISEELFEKLKRSAVYPGDVLLSKVGTIGYSCILPKEVDKAILSTTGSCKITINENIISNIFLCYQLNYLKPYMDRIASEGVQPFLNMKTINNFRLFLPSFKEQLRIVEILRKFDTKIENEENSKSELEQLKKGLLQVLLTGKVRVRVKV